MKFKHKKDETRFHGLCAPLQYFLIYMDFYLASMGIEMVVTCTWTTRDEDVADNRREPPHREFRGADVRSKNIPDEMKPFIIAHLRDKFKGWGAIGKKSGKENLIYEHGVGENIHFHIQIRKDWDKISIPQEVAQ